MWPYECKGRNNTDSTGAGAAGRPDSSGIRTLETIMQALAMTFLLAAALGSAADNWIQTPPAALVQAEGKATELAGKIASYDADSKTLKLEGVAEEIVITDKTRFSGGLSVESLKAGTMVKVSGTLLDGKVEATEVSAAA